MNLDRRKNRSPIGTLGAEWLHGVRAHGQAIVELALILPIVLLLLVGLVDGGRILYYQVVLANAAREGARVGSGPFTTDDAIRAAAIAAGKPVTLVADDIAISPATPRDAASGQTITVTATYRLTPVTPAMELILHPFLVNGRLLISQPAHMVIM